MAQEASGLPYYSGNDTGVGAVYFGDNVDLLDLQRKQGKELRDSIQIREQQNLAKKKLAYEMIGDPNVDTNGILSRDANDIREQASKLQQSYAQLLQQGADPSNPAFIDAYSKFNAEKQALKLAVSQSKSDNEAAKQWLTKVDPKKHDDASWGNMGTFLATPLAERGQYDRSKLLVPKKDDFVDLVGDYLKGVKPAVESEEIKLPSGQTAIKTVTGYSVPQATGLAKAFLNSANKRESAERAYENLPDTEKQAYQARAGATGDPLEIFVQDGIINRSPQQEKLTGNKYSPMAYQYAKLWGDKEKEKEDADYLVERFQYVSSNNDAFGKEMTLPKSEEETLRANFPNMFPPDLIPSPFFKLQTSGVLAGTNLGETNVPIYEKDLLTEQMVVSKYQPIKNKHLYFAKIGGKLFAVTTKSQMLSDQKQGSLYVPVDDDYLDDLTSGATNPLRAKAALKASLEEKGLYKDGRIQITDNGAVNIPSAQPTPAKTAPQSKGKETIVINNTSYPVSKKAKGYQLSKDKKKAKITYVDNTTEIINL